MTRLDRQLEALGDRLESAAAADLAAARQPATRRPRRLALLVAAVLAIAIPGVAIAAEQLTGNEVAQSMPAGTLALAGTEPTCSVVTENVEYHCTLAKPPAPEVSDWKGTVEPSVDASKHINGGCRSLAGDGREWQCYIGQAAVDQKIIGSQLLGEFAPSPGQG